MKSRFFAIVNPAAGGGRCGKLAPRTLDRVRNAGIELEVVQTIRAGEATEIARNAYTAKASRNFLAVGGDGTAFEIINGLFPEALNQAGPRSDFLPLGTGNSFLKDFTTRGIEHTIEALQKRRTPRMRHDSPPPRATAKSISINLLSLGFPADVGRTRQPPVQTLGRTGLYSRRLRAPGAARAPRVSASPCGATMGPPHDACFSPSATANSPAAK